MTPKAKHREAVMRRAYGHCELHTLVGPHACDGRIQAMHLIPVRVLKNEHFEQTRQADRLGTPAPLAGRLDEAIADGRNGIAGDERTHNLIDRCLLEVSRDRLPARLWDFIEEFGLEAVAERMWPSEQRRAA